MNSLRRLLRILETTDYADLINPRNLRLKKQRDTANDCRSEPKQQNGFRPV